MMKLRGALTVGLLLAGASVSCAALPKGVTGPEADALARKMEEAVRLAAWQRTGAVRWTFAGRHHHLWDRQRDWIRVRWGSCEVTRHLWSEAGEARCDGAVVTDPDERRELFDDAYAKWVNDAFWLNPLAKLFDPGVVRTLVQTEDGPGLLVTYSSGGLTPGDSYLWVPDAEGRPRYWKMWVSILPVKGVRASWDAWITLRTGALISTRHETSVFDLELAGVEGAEDVTALLGEDPFAALAGPPAAADAGP